MPTRPIKLLLISTDEECCEWVGKSTTGRDDCCLRRLPGPDVVSVANRSPGPSAGLYDDSDLLVIDLDNTAANPLRFWASIRIAYKLTPVIGIVKSTTSFEVQQVALAARVERFVRMGPPDNSLLREAWNIRRGYTLFGYFPVIEAALQLFQGAGCSSALRLKLHRDRRKACLGDREVALTAHEFDLLLYLAENSGRTVHIDELLRAVWKCSRERGGSTAQVKHCIYRLRKKVEPDQNCFTFLKTVNGHGYRVENVEVV